MLVYSGAVLLSAHETKCETAIPTLASDFPVFWWHLDQLGSAAKHLDLSDLDLCCLYSVCKRAKKSLKDVLASQKLNRLEKQ